MKKNKLTLEEKFLKSKKFALDKTPKQKLPPLRINPMSQEQGLLNSMFGGGDKILFNSPDSKSLPEIRGDLMPHSFGDENESETSEIFGFGINKSRSGLF